MKVESNLKHLLKSIALILLFLPQYSLAEVSVLCLYEKQGLKQNQGLYRQQGWPQKRDQNVSGKAIKEIAETRYRFLRISFSHLNEQRALQSSRSYTPDWSETSNADFGLLECQLERNTTREFREKIRLFKDRD